MTELEIVKKHEYMFRYDGWNDLQAGLMAFGFECDEGWYPLIDKLCTEIEKLDTEKMVRVTQVKEKYGGLIVYVQAAPNEVYDIIDKYEEISYTICEQCGEPGEHMTTGYWEKTVCHECAKERGYMPMAEFEKQEKEIWKRAGNSTTQS